MSGDEGPAQVPVKAKYRVGRTWGYGSRGGGQSGAGGTRRKTGAKQVHDPRVPVLVDGRRVTWMRYSRWQALQAGAAR